MIPWNNIVRLLVPPRMRSGDLLAAILDSLLRPTIQRATQAETFRNDTVALYSNIAQRDVLEELLNSQFPNHNIWIEDTETGSILLFERPGYTPNHTYRQIVGGNYYRMETSAGSGGLHVVRRFGQRLPAIRSHLAPATHGDARVIISSTLQAFDGNDFVIHQTGMSATQVEELRCFVSRIVFLGVGFDIVTP